MDDRLRVVFLKAGAIIALIVGIFFCATIIGVIFGLPLILGYTELKRIYKKTFDLAVADLNNYYCVGWSIVILILSFPLGIFAFLPYVLKETK